MAHFDRERIPERVVHAKGAGAHGYFEVTKDITHLSKAKFLSSVGKRTPVFLRFSTVAGEKGYADTDRDPRGFAVKFYTEEGNWDMTGNNTPVFFVRDPQKFPDFIHTQKRNPRSNLRDADACWDFASLVPESVHQFSLVFSERGTPYGFRHMHGFSSHTLKLVNIKGVAHWVKFHFITDQGIKNLSAEEAGQLAGSDPDFATRDLFENIEKGNYPSWTVNIQVMPFEEAFTYKWNSFDVTKIWPHKDYPLIPIGKMVLNRNPENYFAETEQVAFSPSHMVPGVEPSPDKMLQGRLFSYPDTHRHRLGANYLQIPINRAYCAKINNHQRDGPMVVNGNSGSGPNYEPNSFGGPNQVGRSASIAPFQVSGVVDRHAYTLTDDDFVQPGNLFRLMTPKEKESLINNFAGAIKGAKKHIQQRQIGVFKRVDPALAAGVEKALLKFSTKM